MQPTRPRQPAVRSKSSASLGSSSSMGSHAPRRTPRGASPSSISAAEPADVKKAWTACETRDSATQTAAKGGVRTGTSPHGDEAAGERGEATKQSDFLFGPIQLQSELGMAIQAALEFTAEQRATRSPPDVAALGRQLSHLGGEDESDGEDMAENLEVRSLSLSEDGPVIARELSERQRRRSDETAAPDPIAMLSHTRDREPGDGTKNGSSDLSAAGTESAPYPVDVAAREGGAQAESHEQGVFRNLLPILQPIFEKTAELSGSEPAGAPGHTFLASPPNKVRHAPPTKVRPVRSSSGNTLDLAELKTAGSRGGDPLAKLTKAPAGALAGGQVPPPVVRSTSELSFGSEYSAFTSVSSAASQGGSKDATPRHSRGLTGVASMPALQPYYRGPRAAKTEATAAAAAAAASTAER